MSARRRAKSASAAHRAVTLARTYHEDGASLSAARVLRALIAELSKDADAYEAEGKRRNKAIQAYVREQASA